MGEFAGGMCAVVVPVVCQSTVRKGAWVLTSGFDSSSTYDTGIYSGGAVTAVWVELSDLFFTGAADDSGVEWLIEDLEGWDDGADVRAATSPRPGQDGIWIGDAWYGARMLEMKGTAFAPSRDLAYAAKDVLLARTNLLRRAAVLKVYEDQVRRASVRRLDRPLVRIQNTNVTFSIALVAPDPRKYADAESSVLVEAGGEAVATNAGNVETLATASIDGPVDTPTLVAGDDEVTFDVALVDGETLTVDFDMHTAVVGSASVRPYLVSGYRWWDLPPGDTTVGFDAASGGDAGMDLRWRSAWL